MEPKIKIVDNKKNQITVKENNNQSQELLNLLHIATSQLGMTCPHPKFEPLDTNPFDWVSKNCAPLQLTRIASLKLGHLKNSDSKVVVLLNEAQQQKYGKNFLLIQSEAINRNSRLEVEPLSSTLQNLRFKAKDFFGNPFLHLSPTEDAISNESILNFKNSFVNNWSSLTIAALMINLVSLAIPFFISLYFDLIIPNFAQATLISLSIGLGIVMFFDLLFKYARSGISEMRAIEYEEKFYSKIFRNLFARKNVAYAYGKDKLRNLPQDLSGLLDVNNSKFILPVYDLLFSVLFLLAIFLLGGSLVIISLICFSIAIVISVINARKFLKLDVNRRENYGKQRAVYNNIITGFETASSKDIQNVMKGNLQRATKHSATANSVLRKHLNGIQSITNTITQLQTLFILLWGFFLVIGNVITAGNLFAVMLLSGRLAQSFGSCYSVLSNFYKYKESLKVGIDIIGPLKLEQKQHKLYGMKRGEILTNQLMLTSNGKVVLRDIDLKIEHGDKIALIGPSGGGKTFLLKVLAGLHTPTSGQILYDSVDYNLYHSDAIAREINYVARNPFLFRGSIYINLTADSNNKLDLNHPAIKHLTQFAHNLPKKYNTQVGAEEHTLSYSELKGISIARSFLGNKKVILLDEPDQGLDEHWQSLFMDTMMAMQNKTIIASITNKSLLKCFDKIIIIDKGRIVHSIKVKNKSSQELIKQL